MESVISALGKLVADTYALALKTQNYHWHVKGPNFTSLHLLFEQQYNELNLAVDLLAERILALGGTAPASFEAFMKLTTIQSGNSAFAAAEMVKDLTQDHELIITTLKSALSSAQQTQDEGTVTVLGDRMGAHEKMHWMLKASY